MLLLPLLQTAMKITSKPAVIQIIKHLQSSGFNGLLRTSLNAKYHSCRDPELLDIHRSRASGSAPLVRMT